MGPTSKGRKGKRTGGKGKGGGEFRGEWEKEEDGRVGEGFRERREGKEDFLSIPQFQICHCTIAGSTSSVCNKYHTTCYSPLIHLPGIHIL